jgi:hypothetical protein
VTTTTPATRSAAQDGRTFRSGIEKILTEAPPYTHRAYADGDRELDDWLLNLLSDTADCRNGTWSSVFAHTGEPGEYSAEISDGSCHQRGCPTCGRDHLAASTAEHRFAIAVSFGGGIATLRLTGPTSWGPADAARMLSRWRNHPMAESMVPRSLGLAHPDERGRYGWTVLVPSDTEVQLLGTSWTSIVGGESSHEAHDGATTPFDEVVVARDTADAALFDLVGDGIIEPAKARRWLHEESRLDRLKFMGGFLDADAHIVTVDRASRDASACGERRQGGDAEATRDGRTDYSYLRHADHWELLTDEVCEAERSVQDQSISPDEYEHWLRQIERAAVRNLSEGIEEVNARLDRALQLLEPSHFNCHRHRGCRLAPTGEQLRTRHLRLQAADKVTQDGGWSWSDLSWPEWRLYTSKVSCTS